jgi:hypothetical protein
MEPWATTLNAIREHKPCSSGWTTLLNSLGKTKADDEPLLLINILESNGLEDTLWSLRAVTNHDREIRLFSVWCARNVQHLMTDQRSIDALNVAEQFAKGEVTEETLESARAAAESAAWSAAESAARAACSVTCSAARAAAAWAARAAAESAARAAACSAAEAAQTKELLRIISGGEY